MSAISRRELAALTSPDAEAGLLCALLRGEAVPDLDVDAFTIHRYRLIYQAICDLVDAGRAPQPVTVGERLQQRGELEAAGGLRTISGLMDAWSGSTEACAAILRDKAWHRKVAQAGHRVAEEASRPGGDPDAALAAAARLAAHDDRADAETATPWPKLPPEALYGLAGRVVGAIAPYTESDPVALLLQFLLAFGSAVGRGPHFAVGAALHHLVLYVVLVGATARSRKGSSWCEIRELFREVDPGWADHRQKSGLSSGEGLIWAIRDPIETTEPIRGKDRSVMGYQTVVSDQGVSDKRLLIVEPEFASTLRVCDRDGNTLSTSIRQAWDDGILRTLTKHSPMQATGAHCSIIGHITRGELLQALSATDQANGFANRFLWVAVKRSQLLPDGGESPATARESLIGELREAVLHARTVGRMTRDSDARDIWHEAYGRLSGERPGMLGAITSRAEAQALRVSMVYALLDGSAVICAPHLLAALGVWGHSEASARWIFGDALGDRAADTILGALRGRTDGMTRTEVNNLFGRHGPASEIARALRVLEEQGLARSSREETGGRPVERWQAVQVGTKEGSEA